MTRRGLTLIEVLAALVIVAAAAALTAGAARPWLRDQHGETAASLLRAAIERARATALSAQPATPGGPAARLSLGATLRISRFDGVAPEVVAIGLPPGWSARVESPIGEAWIDFFPGGGCADAVVSVFPSGAGGASGGGGDAEKSFVISGLTGQCTTLRPRRGARPRTEAVRRRRSGSAVASRNTRTGLTLIETLAAVVILSAVAATGGSVMRDAARTARESALRRDAAAAFEEWLSRGERLGGTAEFAAHGKRWRVRADPIGGADAPGPQVGFLQARPAAATPRDSAPQDEAPVVIERWWIVLEVAAGDESPARWTEALRIERLTPVLANNAGAGGA